MPKRISSLRSIRETLSGGDLRSLGRSIEVVELLFKQPDKTKDVVELFFDPDPVVRLRAGDVLEKVSKVNPEVIAPFRTELLSLLCEATQKEMRWHLALMMPRLDLRGADRARAIDALKRYLDDKGAIVRTCALDALAQMGAEEALDLLRQAERSGTPAMRARARKLLAKMER